MYGFLQLCRWFNAVYPDYFVSPLQINGSVESIFSVLKFAAGGNLSASNYGSFGRVIVVREVIANSNSECGYRDDLTLISGSLPYQRKTMGIIWQTLGHIWPIHGNGMER